MLIKIIRGKEKSQRPVWQEIASEDLSAKVYWSQWDSLLLIVSFKENESLLI